MHVVFEITNDQKLLNQYYSLREESYREVLSLSDFNGEEDELDRQSDILIARIGELCLGGIRICGSNSNSKSKPLPLENLTEQLRVKLPFLDLDRNGYCQWMRLTLRPEIDIPKFNLQKQFCLALAKFSKSLGYRYGFCISGKVHHRFYKRLFKNFGYDYWSCENVEIAKEDDFDDLEHLLCAIDVHSLELDEHSGESGESNVTYHFNFEPQLEKYSEG
ncbi:MAG: hypothetical protein HRU24_16635 [Gammaproteobacteria bacterium]|nr:hypothetical protein [Gammaproteobacteria bacterium]